MQAFHLRRAERADQAAIGRIIRRVGINPTGIRWQRFLVAEDGVGRVVGCGQVKLHADGSRELASIAVGEAWRGRGVARAIIQALQGQARPPLWLMCRSVLVPLYARYGFREAGRDEPLPAYFRRVRGLAGWLRRLVRSDQYLAVLVWE